MQKISSNLQKCGGGLRRTFSGVVEDAAEAWKPSVSVQNAWPALKVRFSRYANAEGKFMLLGERQQKAIDGRTGVKIMPNTRQAAVLVLLIDYEGKPSLLFTRRSANLNQHAAEVSFPGGHFDAEYDSTLYDTAVREALEELYGTGSDTDYGGDYDPEEDFTYKVRIIGQTTSLPSIKFVPVTPVVALYHDRVVGQVSNIWPGSTSEVDLVFTVSIEELLKVETKETLANNRFGFEDSKAPVFRIKYQGEEIKIWGLTAYILKPLLHKLFKPVLFPNKTVSSDSDLEITE
jgi:8-oxo-dGTP pyrophosphatase MutT (NUDIX family)